MPESCYGCAHLRFEGPPRRGETLRVHGGPVIPMRDSDANLGPGRYRCRKFERVICRADVKAGPKELEPGCKSR